MFAIGNNVLVEVPKNTERKVGALILLGRGNNQIQGKIHSVGLGVKDERLFKGKIITSLDVHDSRTVSETDTIKVIAVPYDAILSVEE